MKQNKPIRIISLVPSQTELLFDLGLRDEVVGITKFCIHPDEWFRRKRRVGGTKKLKLDLIRELNPDLILANKEENLKEEVVELQKDFPTYVSDISTIEEAMKMITDVGELVQKQTEAKEIVSKIHQEIISFENNKPTLKALYFIWQSPFMVAGNDTFINDMMKKAGFENCISENRYPMLSENDIKNANPDVILLSSEPFPFSEKHIAAFQEICPNAKIILVDGELFSWYGSRMLQSFQYFRALNEELHSI